ncbi:hypothetical protein GUY61_16435 [Streptomyces sp. GC420]|nr:hypothetical protein [Streptomyces sp. GC420]
MSGLSWARTTGDHAAAIGTSVSVLAAAGLLLIVATACDTGGTGTRDEGPARTGAAARTEPDTTPSPTHKKVDPVALVMKDPEVSASIKRELRPCVADEYPVDVSYGNLTGNSVADVVVNVLTCGDAVGVGSYVYRAESTAGTEYENVFKAEQPPVYGQIDRGDLVVTRQVYDRGDPVSNPSGEDVITYRWEGARFIEHDRTHNDYSAVDGIDPAAPAPAQN